MSTSIASSLFAAKATLRKSMLRTLKALPDADVARESRLVADALVQQDFFKRAGSVACYLSMARGELRTDAIVSEILRQGKALYTPYLPPDGDMRMLRLYSPADLAACPTDKWGILDPGSSRRDTGERREDVFDASADKLDLVLLPGVAFDETCERLGRGKAFYDTFLSSYTAAKARPLLVALALDCQLMPAGTAIPTTANDFQLDGVLGPRGIIWRKGASDVVQTVAEHRQ
ncbi:hypothetical protein Q5752_003432 [Cryptotrichosporon argae]